MGVQGLWKLLESTGRPINLESLEGKVLAVDVSIWLNQAVLAGYSNSPANPHLQVLFSRICKLLFYRIKPVFVFDGTPPQIKRQTLAARRQRKQLAAAQSENTSEKIIKNFLKSHAVKAVMEQNGEGTSNREPKLRLPRRRDDDDMFELPPMPSTSQGANGIEGDDESDDDGIAQAVAQYQAEQAESYQDLRLVDVESESFLSLPVEVQHELITEMQESSKRNSWSRMHQLPQQSGDFSRYQVDRLIKKSKLSVRLEDLRKEMKSRMSSSMAALLDAEAQRSQVDAGRVASEDAQHYILMKMGKEDEKEEEDDGALEASVVAYRQRAGFSTSLDIQMEKAMRKRSSAAVERDSSPSTRERDAEVADKDESSPPRKQMKTESADGNASWREEEIEEPGERLEDEIQDKRRLIEELLKKVSSNTDTTRLAAKSQEASSVKAPQRTPDVGKEQSVGSRDAMPDSLTEHQHEIRNSNEIIMLRNDSPKDFKQDQGSSAIDVYLTNDADNETCAGNAENEAVAMETGDATAVDLASNECRSQSKSNQRTVPEKGRTPEVINLSEDDDDSEHVMLQSNVISSPTKFKEKEEEKEEEEEVVEIVEELVVKEEDTCAAKEDFQRAEDDEDGFRRDNGSKISEDDKDGNNDDFSEVADFPIQTWSEVQTEQIVTEINDEEEHYVQGDEVVAEMLQESDQEPDVDEWLGADLASVEAVNQDLENERLALEKERRKQQKKATSVTDAMYADSKELLQCFGIPYIVSPQEAEAQCAYLDLTNQTQGTITEDSDIWLFGGRRVYKQFFSKSRDPEFFKLGDIERHLLLSRDKLINLAYLMGSDYTLGIPGAGHVTAMEVLSEFKGQGLDSLQTFKSWWDDVQGQLMPTIETPVKGKLRKLTLPGDFPNPCVADAYLSPMVDESEDPFEWGVPDLDLIREFARERMGWQKSKVDETLLPVLKRLNEKQAQTKITSFFIGGHGGLRKKITSKRMQQVLRQMGRTDSQVDRETKDQEERVTQKIKKTKKKTKKRLLKGSKVDAASKRRKERLDKGGKFKKGKDKDSGILSKGDSVDSDSETDDKDKAFQSSKTLEEKFIIEGNSNVVSARTRRERAPVNYDEGSEVDDDIPDEALIAIADKFENPHSNHFTRELRNSGVQLRVVKHTKVPQTEDDGVTSSRWKKLPEAGQRGRPRGKGKGQKDGIRSRKGKALLKKGPVVPAGPRLSSSGSDSD
ncbi:DNA excision repair protein ERCC-5-like [Diadema antillarum]|uniref:DNA excision repair protein ERCC-5-like n=1 Tax=Diadema antillarum TaxID=105358 RepID=UPI003A8C4F95